MVNLDNYDLFIDFIKSKPMSFKLNFNKYNIFIEKLEISNIFRMSHNLPQNLFDMYERKKILNKTSFFKSLKLSKCDLISYKELFDFLKVVERIAKLTKLTTFE